MRYNGRPIPARDLANGSPCIGDLRVEHMEDEILRRPVRIARLVDALSPIRPDVLATLYEPLLVAMSPLAFTLSGFERIGEQDFAQSWLVRAAVSPTRTNSHNDRYGLMR
jgi:hypothetical protein